MKKAIARTLKTVGGMLGVLTMIVLYEGQTFEKAVNTKIAFLRAHLPQR